MLALSTNHAYYGTTATPKEFWAVWKEEGATPDAPDPEHEARTAGLINVPLAEDFKARFYGWRDKAAYIRRHFDAQGSRLPTVQDMALVSLLDPARLLELTYQFIVFDNGLKKIARYQQYFAVRATVDRVAGLNARGERTGGVIWHTTGSGKSLTMVMLAKALTLHPAISNPRVILVTDRVNLDEQIYNTFKACGKSVEQAKSGRDLVELVRSEGADIIATVINKFETVADAKVRDDNTNVFVLVDESHRSQYGLIHSKMRQVFSRACYIGFTGTPLTKQEKNTAEKFGSFIHKYPMRQAVDDGAVVPLLYEGRMVELSPHRAALDRWFDRHTQGLTDEQKADLKRKMSRAEVLNDVDRRIQEIAYNLSDHFKRHFKGYPQGLKAQLATSSKAAALRYKHYLDECGELTSTVVISAPDTREGHDSLSEASTPEVQVFWKETMRRYGSEEVYNREVLKDFANAEGVDLLIVVDKLLVGFDQPRNTVLYIDKTLKDHAILQAIARVNRVFPGKDHGYVVDYRGILGELNEAIQTYDALADFDTEDVAGTITDVSAEIAKLPQVHSDLWAVFHGVDTDDSEALARHLKPEDIRQRFYDALTAYARTLKVALSSVVFYEDTPEDAIRRYKRDLKFFHNLRASIRIQFAEAVDYRDYEAKIRNLLDTEIGTEGVIQLTAEVEVFDRETFDRAVEQQVSPRARAEAILNHLKRTAIEKMETDPAYYRKFSQLIEDTLHAIETGRLDDLEAVRQADELRDEAVTGRRSDVPAQLLGYRHAPAYYGVLHEVLNDGRLLPDQVAELAIQMEHLLEARKIRDWANNGDVQNQMKNDLDDYLYDLKRELDVALTNDEIESIIEQIVHLARQRS